MIALSLALLLVGVVLAGVACGVWVGGRLGLVVAGAFAFAGGCAVAHVGHRAVR